MEFFRVTWWQWNPAGFPSPESWVNTGLLRQLVLSAPWSSSEGRVLGWPQWTCLPRTSPRWRQPRGPSLAPRSLGIGVRKRPSFLGVSVVQKPTSDRQGRTTPPRCSGASCDFLVPSGYTPSAVCLFVLIWFHWSLRSGQALGHPKLFQSPCQGADMWLILPLSGHLQFFQVHST